MASRNKPCGHVTAKCVCIRKEGHKGPHVCDCGGAITTEGRVYAFPREKGLYTPATVERYARRLKKPANLATGLLAAMDFLGGLP